jgi:hypothetical protein
MGVAAIIVGFVVFTGRVRLPASGARPADTSVTPVQGAKAQVSAAPTAATTAAEASSAAVSINSLPDAAEEAKKKKAAAAGPGPAQSPAKEPERTADKPTPDKPVRKVPTDKVPIFTNPGF